MALAHLGQVADGGDEVAHRSFEIKLKIAAADDAFLGVEVDQDERPAIEKTDLRDDGTFERNGEGSELDTSAASGGEQSSMSFSYLETRTPPSDSSNS